MADYSKVVLSGSTNGMPIKVVATATLGTTIHTAGAGTTILDEIWLYVTNNHTAAVVLTIEFGGAEGEKLIQQSVPSKTGLYLLVPGLVLNNAKVVTAFATTANVISILGWVNRITP